MARELTRVEPNEYSGTIYVLLEGDIGYVNVSQRYMSVVNHKLQTITRRAVITGRLEQIEHYVAGDILPGNIYIKESMMPFNMDEPEELLAIDEQGNYEKVNGRYLWRYTIYSQDEEEYDEIVPRNLVITTK